ncbi:MAG: dipicolinate synthase subunit DpsA [Methylocystaceae bacterium]
MSTALSGIKTAVIGGDDREIILMTELVKMGATVTAVGFPRDKVSYGICLVKTVEDALKGAEVAILPMPGTSPEGTVRAVYCEDNLVLTKPALSSMTRPGIVVIGSARDFLHQWVEELNLTLFEIAEMDEVAILNSIPTAEGAIQIAMEETAITIHGSRCIVVGLGRVGQTLAHKLAVLNAQVTVVSQQAGERARAKELSCLTAGFDELTAVMQNADIVFNTVPSLVISREVIKTANPECLIIDLAASPGGTDFEAANNYGIKAILAPGLPGKVAPVSAGKILAEVIPQLVIKEISRVETAQAYA